MSELVNKNILIADNDELIVRNLKEFLINSGYKIETAENCNDLIKKVKKNQYGIIILDYYLKDSGAFNVLDELYNINSTAVVIIMFSDPSVDKVITAFRKGVTDIIVKPFNVNELNANLEKAFKQCRRNIDFQVFSRKIKKDVPVLIEKV